jgi:oxygen-independent coproporphyrinogen-3 oxidase
MAGIYIHIPFCKKACHYCNFHFSTSNDGIESMIMAIEKEILLREEIHNQEISTIYFGGGTPSIIPINLLTRLLKSIHSKYNVSSNAEITLEANPDDITQERSIEWKSIGINRFSIGIQSFIESDLQWMNRAHNSIQSKKSIEIIQSAGFKNFSIDLIYGTPGQTIEQWNDNLDIAFGFNIPHLSCYALTVEEGTALHKMIANNKKQHVDSDLQSVFFETLMKRARQAGYSHYEISNFAKPTMESKHNTAYWEGIPYWGFGPSAHSFDGNKRRWNISHNIDYIKSVENNIVPFEEETLDEVDHLNEYIMTSLRRKNGIEKSVIIERWGSKFLNQIDNEIAPFVNSGKVENSQTHYLLKDEGKFFADGIAAALFELKKN